YGERGVVGKHGVDPDDDRICAIAETVHLPKGRLPGTRARPWVRDPSVDCRGELQQHRGATAPQTRHESRVEALGLVPKKALFDLDPRGAEPADALPIGARVGVAHRDNDANDARLAYRVDARWCPALVNTGLEVREERTAAGSGAGFAERVDLGVWLARGAVITLADGFAVPDDDGADE